MPAIVAAGLAFSGVANAQFKSYDSNKPSFWQNPPPDWFLGDETEAQKGLAPPSAPRRPTPLAELNENLKRIKLPPGFKIEVYASGIPEARQMAWGDNGTLFVGSFGATNVYAVKDEGGKRKVKTILKGLNMPTGVAFRERRALCHRDRQAAALRRRRKKLDDMPKPVVVYDDMPSYASHGWKYHRRRSRGAFFIALRPALQHRHPAHQRRRRSAG